MTTTGAEQTALSVLAFLAESSVRALALAVVAGLAIVALRGRRAAMQLWIWTIVLYAAIAVPVVTKLVPEVGLPVPAFALTGYGGPAESGGGAVISSQPSGVWLPQAGPTPRKVALEPVTIAFGIYLIGVAVLLLRAGVGWMMTRRLERASDPVDEEDMLTRLSRHAAVAGLKRPPRLTESTRLLVPVTTSVRHPMIVLPVSWREWSGVKIDAVLAHEMAHIARHDTLTQRLSLIYRAAFWPNPFSWWLHTRIAALAEQVSDEAALGAGIDRTTYAEALVGFFAEHQRDGGRRAVWHMAMARGGSAGAEERVERVLAWDRGRSTAVTKRMAMVIALLAAPLLVLASAVRPEPVRAAAVELPAPHAVPTPAPAADPRPLAVPQQATVYQPGNGVKNPVPIKRADPKYTDEARLAGIQGNVELDVVVLADGTIGDVRITKSLQPGLDAQAILSAKQWLFKPAMKDGSPVAMIVGLVVEFKLPQVPAAAPVVLPGMYDGHGKQFYFFNYLPNGQGVVPPKPIKQVNPKYTSEALRARIEGEVEVEVVVLTDGTVGDVRVTKSLDTQFGLDDAAWAAARQWRFQPATKDGQPVEYTCTLSLQFKIYKGTPAPAAIEPYPSDTPGLVAPAATKRVDPKYTSDAMRAKIQGTVELDVVVQADGTIGEVRITKSLDTQFGLDQEAIAAVKGYTFTAATLNGSPVAAIVKLIIEFRLH